MKDHARRLIVFALLYSLSFISPQARGGSEPSDKVASPLPFAPAEELFYEGEVSRSLFRGLNIAEFRLAAREAGTPSSVSVNQGDTAAGLHFTLEAVSKGFFAKLFGLRFRQRIDSKVERGSFTVRRTSKLDEQGDRVRTSEAVFDHSARRVVWTELDPKDPNRPPRVVTSGFSGAVQDIASAIYFLRTQPLASGTAFEVAVSDSGRVYQVPVRVMERKRMKTVLGSVYAVRVVPEVFGQERLIEHRGKASIWLTDDARRIPVLIHVSTEMGTMDIKLKRVEKKENGKRQK